MAEMFSMLRMMMSFSRPVMIEVAVGVLLAEVAGAEPAVLVEGVRVEGRVEVAPHHLRRLGPDLALLAGAGDGAVELHQLQLDAGHRLALGLGLDVLGVVLVDQDRIGASVRP